MKEGCILHQGYDLEVGAGTFNPATFLRSIGPEPYKAAYLALVAAQATKAGEEVTIDTYADKSIEDCEVLLTEYATKIAALPDGQQLEGGEQADTSAALNESFYKV